MPTVNEERRVPYGASSDWNERIYRPGEWIGTRSGSYSSSDSNVEFVYEEAQAAADAMHAILLELGEADDGHGVVPLSCAEELKTAHEALDSLSRHLPYVEAWACGYWWGSSRTDDPDDRPWSTWSAHWSAKTAARWLIEWEKQWATRRTKQDWGVRFMPVRATYLMERRADPRVIVRGVVGRLS